MGQACSQRQCCNVESCMEDCAPPSARSLPASARSLPASARSPLALKDAGPPQGAASAPGSRLPTLLCGGCDGDAGPALTAQGFHHVDDLRKCKDSPGKAAREDCGGAAHDEGHGEGLAREATATVPMFSPRDAGDVGLGQLSARSAGYLDREACELLRLRDERATPRNGVPHRFASGAIYTGQWKGSMRHGLGRQVWPDGATYEGKWSENCADGNGRFLHRDGDLFVGQWRANVANGVGAYYHKAPALKVAIVGARGLHGLDLAKSGAFCICEVPGKPSSRFETKALRPEAEAEWGHEVAIAEYAIGDSLTFALRGRGLRGREKLLGRARLPGEKFHPAGFEGELPLKSRRGTRGYLRVRVAAVLGAYQGDWVDDKQSGFGVETWTEGWTEGARYSGQFANGQKHGLGTYRWPDGCVYQGRWVHNVIEGEGMYLAEDGRCFKGQWKGSLIHGLGQYLWPGGRWYSGQYIHDQKHGFGIFHWPDGKKYEGFWADGKQEGVGRLTLKGGSSRLSHWEQGRRTSDVA